MKRKIRNIQPLINFNNVQRGTKMTDAHQSPSSSHIAIYFTVFLTNLHISFLQRHQLLYKYILDDKI